MSRYFVISLLAVMAAGCRSPDPTVVQIDLPSGVTIDGTATSVEQLRKQLKGVRHVVVKVDGPLASEEDYDIYSHVIEAIVAAGVEEFTLEGLVIHVSTHNGSFDFGRLFESATQPADAPDPPAADR